MIGAITSGEEIFAGATISARLDGDVAWLLLGGPRPFVLDENFPADFVGSLDAIEASKARALVVAGTTKVFCAGADLRLGPNLREPAFGRRWLDGHHEAIRRLVVSPLPTVAAVQGAAAGAGCNIAIACDHVVAVAEAGFSQAFIRIGLATDMGSIFLLHRRTGPQVAREMMLTGREVSGDEAVAMRLADEVVTASRLLPRAREIATERAARPLAAYAAIKRGLTEGLSLSLRASLDLERDLQLEVMQDPDFEEGAIAFLEKRKPRYGMS